MIGVLKKHRSRKRVFDGTRRIRYNRGASWIMLFRRYLYAGFYNKG